MIPTITTFGWVPEFARGLVRDLRPRWAFEEVGQPYKVDLITIEESKGPGHRRYQPFGQVPAYRDEEVSIFESGAMVLRIAERAGKLIPADPSGRARAVQWLLAALNTIEPALMALMVNDVFEADQAWSKPRHARLAAFVRTRLGELEAALGDKQWLDGSTFTVGDLMMVTALRELHHTGELKAEPRLAAFVARGESRPAFRKALADHMAVFDTPAAA